MTEVKTYEGETILKVSGFEQDSEELVIETDKRIIAMYHQQDCCETVFVEDVVGTLKEGSKLFEIVEKISDEPRGGENEYDSFTYTFYTFKTSKGYVDVRWVGSSNGYYSEGVTISERMKK